jgi:hypothetical protein
MEVGGQHHAPAGKEPGWVDRRARLDGCGKSRSHRNSNPGPSSPIDSRYTYYKRTFVILSNSFHHHLHNFSTSDVGAFEYL